jgi:uncharacterized protein YerC
MEGINMADIFKVVKIIDAYSIVINGGSNDKLNLGDKLEIFVKGEEVIDLDTKESLGTLDYIKARIEITTILPKMSVCKDIKEEYPYSAIRDTINSMGQTVKKVQQLNVDSMDISGIEEKDIKIKIGDLVRKSV